MKMTSAVKMLAVGLCLLPFSAYGQRTKMVMGSKTMVTKQVKVEAFDKLSIHGSAEVLYRQMTGENGVEITGPDNVVPLLETYVENGTLVVKYKKEVNVRNGKLHIKIHSPEFGGLTLNGSGDVHLLGDIRTANDVELKVNGSGNLKGKSLACRALDVSIAGSGDVELKGIESNACKLRIAGSGEIDLGGQTKRADFSIAGSGEIDADDLQATDVSVSIAGSGDVSCHATEKLKVRIAGSGNVAYKGNPQQIDAHHKHVRKIE